MAAKNDKFDFEVLRILRRKAGKTIGQVSKESGISPAVISRLERNQSAAELDTMARLARIFGMTAGDLVGLAERRMSKRVRATSYRNGGFTFNKIGFENAVCFIAQVKAGAKASRPEVHQDDFEICWVEEGLVRLILPSESHRLEPGEAIQFDAVMEHTYEALKDSRLVLVHLPKQQHYKAVPAGREESVHDDADIKGE